MKTKKFIVALVHVDRDLCREHSCCAGDLNGDLIDVFCPARIEAVGKRGTVVHSSRLAKRYTSIKRALNAAQNWAWYADVVRVMEVPE
jgi:hypothetical protein